MKHFKSKILASVMSAVMVVGTFAGMGTLVANAATYPTSFTVKAVDESGNALEGVELVFEKDGETFDFDTTDQDGEASLEQGSFFDLCEADQAAGGDGTGTFEIKAAKDSGYTNAGDPLTMEIAMAPNSYGFPYISKVNGAAYDEETVNFTLKATGSTEPTEPSKPVVDKKTLNVKVVNEKGHPVSGVQLHMYSDQCCDNAFAAKTDENGKASYMLKQTEGVNVPFVIAPADGEDYEVVTPLKEIYLAKDAETNERYFAKVNGEAYNGEEATLVVRKVETDVTEVLNSTGKEVKRAGDTAEVTVKGIKLPSTLYYVLTCYSEKGVYVRDVKEKSVQATGTATEKKITVELPSVLKYPQADYWTVGVSAVPDPSDGYMTTKGDNVIRIVKDSVTEESKTAMSETLNEAEKKDASAYTEESWKAYQDAVENAKEIAAKTDATNTEYQNAIQAVKDAEAALEAKKESEVKPEPKPEPTQNKSVASVQLAKITLVYNGKVQKPAVVAKDKEGKTIAASAYTVTYASGCKNVGKYSVKVTFKGEYKGTYTRTFKIIPKGTKFKSVKAGKKSLKAKWAKQKTQTTGYQIQYTTDKKFKKSVKTTTLTKNKYISKTIKKLKKHKRYYVRIRTYKKVGKTTYPSAWSKVKSVKVK